MLIELILFGISPIGLSSVCAYHCTCYIIGFLLGYAAETKGPKSWQLMPAKIYFTLIFLSITG